VPNIGSENLEAKSPKEQATMVYKPNRQDCEETILMLADRYPKCFFKEPRLRRPLKHGITADMQSDGLPVARELMIAAVEWYQSHIGYLNSLQAGAKRVDLNGREVDTVTEQQAIAAQAKLRGIYERRRDVTETVSALHAAGRIPDDQLRKVDAPMIPATKATKAALAPELTRLYDAVMAANSTLTSGSDAGLRSAMAAAALGVVCDEAQRLVDDLNHALHGRDNLNQQEEGNL
jgi:sRNA-binding protein